MNLSRDVGVDRRWCGVDFGIMSQPRVSLSGLYHQIGTLVMHFSKAPAITGAAPEVTEITVQELNQLLDNQPETLVLIDVRYPEEHEHDRIPNATLVPFLDIVQGQGITQIQQLLEDRQRKYPDRVCRLIVYCTGGIRSAQALMLLRQAGIDGINLLGGMEAWNQEIQFLNQKNQQTVQLKHQTMSQGQTQRVRFTFPRKLSWLQVSLSSAVLAIGLFGWYGYKVVHHPDKLRPLIQAGVPLHTLAWMPVLGEAFQAAELPEVTVQELKQKIDRQQDDYVVVDVRAPEEYNGGSIPGAVLVPLTEIEAGPGIDKIKSMVKGRTLYAYCAVGYRSGKALVRLQKAGIEGIQVKGGIVEWNMAHYPTMLHN